MCLSQSIACMTVRMVQTVCTRQATGRKSRILILTMHV